MDSTAERIKALRSALGLTLEQVGDAVGVNKATVLRWESGEIESAKASKIMKLARVLHTTPEFIVFGEDNKDQYVALTKEERKLLADYKRAKASNNRAVLALVEAIDRLLGIDEQENGEK